MHQMRAIGYEDGRNLAAFFNICFPLWMRQSHVVNTPRLFSMLMSMVKPFLSENVANNVTLHSGDLATLRKHFRYLLSNSHRILNSNLLDLHRKKGVWDRGYFYPLFLVVVNTFPCRFLSWVLLLLESLYSCPFVWQICSEQFFSFLLISQVD